ncbi:gamma-glutamyltransferase family protein [Anaerotruncus rubiinfantis]|uniref:gamma-glutamyltransferase family protein n=1 Tax=Anaerotruncus rubiinfantis TaxID=1720200 RepID=UPI00082EBE12|nr:gamma-glutamyltransferase family protein [Anaerotruncus rubiinfantis]
MNFNPMINQYPSKRNVVYGAKGMVATSQPLAAQAGLEILRQGGNAIDAAIAAATCLAVVECGFNGIGGDAFALVWTGGKLHGLNASGPAPKNISAEKLWAKGFQEMPKYGFEPVTVPGAPSAWAELSRKYGRLPLKKVMEPAIRYAREGHPVSVNNAQKWQYLYGVYAKEFKGDEFKPWFDTFSVNGAAPNAGDLFKCEDMARSLESIAETHAESFYRGELMERMVDYSDQYGGYFSRSDFEEYRPEWVEPIHVNYRGYDIHEIPPNGHGISALMALNILKGFAFDGERESAEVYHKQIEAMKLAYMDAKTYVTDPRYMKVSVQDLLSDAYADERRRLIGKTAMLPPVGKPQSGGTVYLCAADDDGNMVSYIQSNYMCWGSGLVVPHTGIALHNRGNNFSLEKGHDNLIAGGKKPYHTIIPGFMTKDGKPVGPFGVMGAFMQPQGHVQVVTNTLDFHMNPQDALNAPRWQWMSGKAVDLECDVPQRIVQELADRGHQIKIHYQYSTMGKGEIIWRMENGVLCGGAEPRADGTVAAW